ncbi:MAG: histone deacetylase family protein, partial [Candidatus Deferrimicrobiaceae bacterium]
MKRVAWIYHPDYLLHTPSFEHPESPERLVAITDHLGGAGLIDRMVPVTPEYPEDADILSVHDREYLNKLENACRRGDLTLDSEDTYLNRHSFNIALLSAGGAIAGAKAVAEGTVDRAFCAIRPPGHHAGRNVGMGFCLLNNAAVAARYLQARHGVGKVLIVDWDVHHGNGTQNIVLEDPTVFYFSIHEHPTFLYPGTGRRWEIGKGKGEGATLNAPMAPGAGDAEYRTTFEQMLEPAVERFLPEIILVS